MVDHGQVMHEYLPQHNHTTLHHNTAHQHQTKCTFVDNIPLTLRLLILMLYKYK